LGLVGGIGKPRGHSEISKFGLGGGGGQGETKAHDSLDGKFFLAWAKKKRFSWGGERAGPAVDAGRGAGDFGLEKGFVDREKNPSHGKKR